MWIEVGERTKAESPAEIPRVVWREAAKFPTRRVKSG